VKKRTQTQAQLVQEVGQFISNEKRLLAAEMRGISTCRALTREAYQETRAVMQECKRYGGPLLLDAPSEDVEFEEVEKNVAQFSKAAE
jgi:hypothetical protein